MTAMLRLLLSHTQDAWIPAAEYFGTKGFCASYNLKPGEPLRRDVARPRADGFSRLQTGKLDGNALARELHKLDVGPPASAGDGSVTAAEFAELIGLPVPAANAGLPCKRSQALGMLWEALTAR